MFDANLDFNRQLNAGPPLKMPKIALPKIEPRVTPNPSPNISSRTPNFSKPNRPATSTNPAPNQTPIKSGFEALDFSKNFKIKHGIYNKGFRNQVIRGLKGTLKHFSDRARVADMLWNARGQGGITKTEARRGLRREGLSVDQIKAVRRKLKIY